MSHFNLEQLPSTFPFTWCVFKLLQALSWWWGMAHVWCGACCPHNLRKTRHLGSRNIVFILLRVSNAVIHLSHMFAYKHYFLTIFSNLLYVRSPQGHILLQSRKFFFFRLSWNFFSAGFGPLGLRNCNKNVVCLSSVCLMKFLTALAVTVLVLLVWNLVHLCIYGIPRDTEEFFWNFLFFFRFYWIFLHFWDLANFWGEIQTTSKSKSYGFYGLNGPF